MADKKVVGFKSEIDHAQESHSPNSPSDANETAVSKNAPARGSASTSSDKKKAVSRKKKNKTHPVGFIRQTELVDRVTAYDPDADEAKLNQAYVFAMKAHGGQTRHSGDPYFSHPLSVAALLTELRADPATVMTALLHDVVEDTDHTVEEIRDIFGDEVAGLVDGVTKLSQLELQGEASTQAENFRKFVMAMADDVRVLLVKLADRLHNMQTLHYIKKPEKRQRIALETMEIYAPLAGRIGVQRFREQLEDIAFAELSPDAHETISHRLEDLRSASLSGVVSLATDLREKLKDEKIPAEVYSREKRAYSIWRKMQRKNVPFDELADIYAFRVLVDSETDCYRALGVIHRNWRMIPSEFDDYISAPKPNNYKSIHTAVVGPPSEEGHRQRIEIQIRTFQMHESAERGVAAHWQYKDAGRVEIVTAGHFDPYETPRRLVEMFKAGEDIDEALQYAKLELFQDQVFCFTPKNRVITLPKGSTAIDFAYALHTDVGDQCIGAKINGHARPLRTPLETGDVVKVLRSENAPVPTEWESLAVTGRARSAIRRRIKKMQHDEHLAFGRSIAESVFTGAHLKFSTKGLRAALKTLEMKSVDEVLIAVGRGDLPVDELIEAVYPGAMNAAESEIRPSDLNVFSARRAILGLTPGVEVALAPCCRPLPGERIVGIRGEDGSIDVHTIYCDMLAKDDPDQSRWLDLKWAADKDDIFVIARIHVSVQNGVGVLSEVANIVARYGVSISGMKMRTLSRDFIEIVMDVEVRDVKQLNNVLAGVRAAPSVISAERAG